MFEIFFFAVRRVGMFGSLRFDTQGVIMCEWGVLLLFAFCRGVFLNFAIKCLKFYACFIKKL